MSTPFTFWPARIKLAYIGSQVQLRRISWGSTNDHSHAHQSRWLRPHRRVSLISTKETKMKTRTALKAGGYIRTGG